MGLTACTSPKKVWITVHAPARQAFPWRLNLARPFLALLAYTLRSVGVINDAAASSLCFAKARHRILGHGRGLRDSQYLEERSPRSELPFPLHGYLFLKLPRTASIFI